MVRKYNNPWNGDNVLCDVCGVPLNKKWDGKQSTTCCPAKFPIGCNWEFCPEHRPPKNHDCPSLTHPYTKLNKYAVVAKYEEGEFSGHEHFMGFKYGNSPDEVLFKTQLEHYDLCHGVRRTYADGKWTVVEGYSIPTWHVEEVHNELREE